VKTASEHAAHHMHSGAHSAWKENAQFWGTKWGYANEHLRKNPTIQHTIAHLRKTSPGGRTSPSIGAGHVAWRNHTDISTYQEQCAQRAQDPHYMARAGKAAVFGGRAGLATEGARLIPLYDPRTGKVHTLDHVAKHMAQNLDRDGYFDGSTLKKDPVGSTVGLIMCDPFFLVSARVMRQENGEWVSVQDLAFQEATRGAGLKMTKQHRAAIGAFQDGNYAAFHEHMRSFTKSVNHFNADSFAKSGHRKASAMLRSEKPGHMEEFARLIQVAQAEHAKKRKQVLAKGEPPSPYDLERQLEKKPIELLRQAKAAKKAGKRTIARKALEKIAEKFPHSGYTDDALLDVALADYEDYDFEEAAKALETFVDRYYKSDLLPKVLYYLARCYDEHIDHPDVRKRWAIANYKKILAKYNSENRDWKAEVVQLAARRHKAIEVYRLLVDNFPNTHWGRKARTRLQQIAQPEEKPE